MPLETNYNKFFIFDRNFIKNNIFKNLYKIYEEVLDFKTIDENKKKLILPLKKNYNVSKVLNNTKKARMHLNQYFRGNDEIREIIKLNFSKYLQISLSDIKTFEILPLMSRLSIPNQDKILDWHQDTGTWFHYDLINDDFNKKNSTWDDIVYTLWISLCDCNNKNGLEVIFDSSKYGLQNVKLDPVSLRRGLFNVGKSIINNDIKKLKTTKLCYDAGYANYFNSCVFHRSMANTSNEIRVSVDFRYTLTKKETVNFYGIDNKILKKRFYIKRNINLFKAFMSLVFLKNFFIRKFQNLTKKIIGSVA